MMSESTLVTGYAYVIVNTNYPEKRTYVTDDNVAAIAMDIFRDLVPADVYELRIIGLEGDTQR